MDFHRVHFYPETASGIDLGRIIKDVAQVFTNCSFDVCKPFFSFEHHNKIDVVERARISEIKQPFERQPKEHKDFDLYGRPTALYDGFELQRLLASPAFQADNDDDDIHIIFTDLLTCTFSEDDWRYHARAVICGTPSIISTTGMVEAPAKPREFYISQFGADVNSLKKKLAGRFIDYGDKRMTQVATGYVLQALFFFVTEGEPFCDSDACRLYNAHWQEDLIRTQVENPALCPKHRSLANKFNRRLAARKRI
ncbi:DUF6775 family putative metallopeptidase [Nitrososphaera viennensis]|uniref:Uncharacterized protein n=2 Tax=Nitrososphaera viennensis TaxID=1034015 RepID=A0A060HPA3_9ARCH|nr:DUF6775 family putative metallopeptidase [Nitrososphaera viennensis]AIC15032.1 hypothetical protein NVIE_008150 [Nitrososphaera viennensis EN76]UVS69961.1 hypothetical protein NWT39_04040 [Nitrososphaera viennensis]